MDVHSGQLFVEGAKYGLAARVSLDAKHLRVTTEDAVWTWPVRQVAASRWQGNQFKLTLRDEELFFTADRPVMFTFEVVDRLARAHRRRTTSKRRPVGRKRARSRTAPSVHAGRERPAQERPAREPAEPVVTSVAQSEIWTDLVSGLEESTLMGALAELANSDQHSHRFEPGDDHSDGTLQVCAECSQVFVDLNAAEESTTSRTPELDR